MCTAIVYTIGAQPSHDDGAITEFHRTLLESSIFMRKFIEVLCKLDYDDRWAIVRDYNSSPLFFDELETRFVSLEQHQARIISMCRSA